MSNLPDANGGHAEHVEVGQFTPPYTDSSGATGSQNHSPRAIAKGRDQVNMQISWCIGFTTCQLVKLLARGPPTPVARQGSNPGAAPVFLPFCSRVVQPRGREISAKLQGIFKRWKGVWHVQPRHHQGAPPHSVYWRFSLRRHCRGPNLC